MNNDLGTVQDEQFEGKNNTSENTKSNTEDNILKEDTEGKKEDFPETVSENKKAKEPSVDETDTVSDFSDSKTMESEDDVPDQKGQIPEKDTVSELSSEENESSSGGDDETKTQSDDVTSDVSESEKSEPDETDEEKESADSGRDKEEEKQAVDFASLSKPELVNELINLLESNNVETIFRDVDIIKNTFYKKHKAEIDKLKEKFISEGGNDEDFKPVPDEQELKLKELLNTFKERKSEINKQLEDDKIQNLEIKHRIIEDIKDLVNRKEAINKTFQEFRDLQQEWRNTGLVPQQNVKGLWESYHLACEMFYDYIKINKELRDLDLKKNLESKITLCEKAEKLLLEPSVINSFKTLQLYHDQWREIGPVPADKKTEIWERFKGITSKINKRHHQYFENLKDNQKTNLQEKQVLCEKVEEINQSLPESAKEWEEKSREIIEIQKTWKTIGFAPKKDNNSIYQRFRTACDLFFNAKREFFSHNKEEQKNNLQIKTDLCVQAEALKDSTDWKNTTNELIQLQKRWKEIGPVPKKYSDHIWERFRSACDAFFENKSHFFSNIDDTYDDNLKKKQDLIEEIKNYKLVKDVEKNFENINEFQKRWAEIGFVPFDKKDEIQNAYREEINKLFDQLKVDDHEKNILKFNNKLNDIYSKPNASQKLRQEKEKLIKRLTNLENDIVVWENNIGFFSNSKNADSLIKDVKSKIENGRSSIELLKEKIRSIEKFRDENDID